MLLFKHHRFFLTYTILLAFAFLNKSATGSSLGGKWNYEKAGSIKSFFGFRNLNQQNVFERNHIFFNEDRFRIQGALTHPNFRLEFADEAFVFVERSNPSPLPLPNFSTTSAWKASWNLLERKNLLIVGRLDRFFAQFLFGDFQIIVGKQVIAIGVGHIFTAVSQVQRYLFDFID